MAPRFDQLKMVDGIRKPLGTINGMNFSGLYAARERL
jgi:hypothetical protein